MSSLSEASGILEILVRRWSTEISTRSTLREPLILAALMLSPLVLWRVLDASTPIFLLDDAYITLHNARWFFAQSDPLFPEAAPLASATSLIHTAFITLLLRVGFDGPVAVEISLWIAGYLYASGLLALARLKGCNLADSLLMFLIGLLVAFTPFHLMSGLETSLALAVVAWGLVADSRRPLAAGLLIGIAPEVRPELGLLSLSLFPGYVRTRGLRGIMVIASAAVPCVLTRYLVTGTVLPTTLGAKAAFFAQPMAAPDRALETLTILGLLALLNLPLTVAAVSGWIKSATPSTPFRALLTLATIGIFAHTSPAILWHNHTRYVTPLVPVLIAGLIQLPVTTRRVLAVGALVWACLMLPVKMSVVSQARGQIRAATRTADWVVTHGVKGPILIHDVGLLPDLAPAVYYDIVGIKSPSAQAVLRRWQALRPASHRSVAVAELACRTEARSLVSLRLWENSFAILDGLREVGITPVQVFESGGSVLDYRIYTLSRGSSSTCFDWLDAVKAPSG